MPFTLSGQLGIVAIADLGGLGATEGPRVPCDWAAPVSTPFVLPFLLVLGLMALKPNRNGAAWWMMLPAGCLLVVSMAPPDILPSGMNSLMDALVSFAFGLVAVWLLATYLRRPHRMLTFLFTLGALLASSLLVFALRQIAASLPAQEMMVAMIALGLGVGGTAVVLFITGLICRKRYRPVGVYFCLAVLLPVLWIMGALPFFLPDEIRSGGSIDWSQFFIPVLAVAAVHFAVMLPFLILSSAVPLYRERLKLLLNIREPVLAATPPLPNESIKT